MKLGHEGVELDGVDLQILSLLQQNCKLPLAKIGEKIGLSAPSVIERIKKLEGRGVIRGYTAILDARNQLLGINTVSVGTLNSSIVHPRECFKPAILMGAASIILAHNHPSGDTTPSREDIELTKRLRDAGEILGIEVLDHLIITDTSSLSLKEAGHF